ncbi:uncharacterized protein LOC113236263, partial [Hyposmocoma kahamanoa]|uniref:uncharacterized protein LOC113236263 n=1 Tax=Hyposmocoma kahamanoa TaxID=1477025 RepID=UPI000E6D7EE9
MLKSHETKTTSSSDFIMRPYLTFASTLPTRLSELSFGTNASFRALLDALAASCDLVLFDVVVTLSSGDETKGWWDEGIDNCMSAVAAKDGSSSILRQCRWKEMSLTACRRVLVPLLRYSTSTTVEQYFSTNLKEILATVQLGRVVSNRTKLLEYTTAFILLQLAIEKIQSKALESPTSTLYSEIKPQRTWYLIVETCKACVGLRKLKCCDSYEEVYRQFQVANYNCLCAAICKKKPMENIYSQIFDHDTWARLVDKNRQYDIPLLNKWHQRTKRTPISVEVETDEHTNIHTGTVRTRMFLRTLSENPLQYDLIADNVEETVITQDLTLRENELNNHECAPTLTAVLCHMSTLGFSQWKDLLAAALSGDLHKNAKWLLAQ